MSDVRLSAHDAYELVSKANPFAAAELICSRANDGILTARAQTLIWGDKRKTDVDVPAAFWWARGKAALTQRWHTGDFETWIERQIHCRAYGVSFLASDIRAMLPRGEPSNSPIGAGKDANSNGLLSAADALLRVQTELKMERDDAADLIVRYCAADLLHSRCEGSKFTHKSRYGIEETEAGPSDLDHMLWENITFVLGGVKDWANGRFFGRIIEDGETTKVRLTGVCFHASEVSDMIAAELIRARAAKSGGHDAEVEVASQRGRKAKYDWPAAALAIFGLIHRGDFKPESQAEIEKALQGHLAQGDKEPSESTVRPYAKLIWDESQKA